MQRVRRNSGSGRRGVDRNRRRWQATLQGRVLYLGYDLELATRVFDIAAIEMYRRWAALRSS